MASAETPNIPDAAVEAISNALAPFEGDIDELLDSLPRTTE